MRDSVQQLTDLVAQIKAKALQLEDALWAGKHDGASDEQLERMEDYLFSIPHQIDLAAATLKVKEQP